MSAVPGPENAQARLVEILSEDALSEDAHLAFEKRRQERIDHGAHLVPDCDLSGDRKDDRGGRSRARKSQQAAGRKRRKRFAGIIEPADIPAAEQRDPGFAMSSADQFNHLRRVDVDQAPDRQDLSLGCLGNGIGEVPPYAAGFDRDAGALGLRLDSERGGPWEHDEQNRERYRQDQRHRRQRPEAGVGPT